MHFRILALSSALCWTFLAHAHSSPPDKEPKKDISHLITKDTQKSIDAGLAYLVKGQNDDGSFGTGVYKGNTGITGLAGLAFLAGGHVPDEGENGQALTKAIRNLLSLESKAIPGFLHNEKAGFYAQMYGHGFATHFLAEAYPKITDKQLKAEVKKTLERGVKLIVDSQNSERGLKEGGWRYQPRKGDADLSVTAAQIGALCSARDAGFEVPKETLDRALNYVKLCEDPRTGGLCYLPGGPPTFGCSAAALVCLNRLGAKEDKLIKNGMKYLERGKVRADDMHYFYAHYYATKALWLTADAKREDWYKSIRDELMSNRKRDSHWESGIMCRHYATAMALLILQTPFEHVMKGLPPADRPPPEKIAAEKKDIRQLITAETKKAIDAGLAELAKTQKDDGSWGLPAGQYNVGITSIAGLAFLSGPPQPEHGKVVGKALAFVLSKQDKQGFIGPRSTPAMYGHGYALLFLADVSENLSDKKQKDEVKSAMEKAAKVLVDSQSPMGGWRYLPTVSGQDCSITAVQLQALCAARQAGVEVPQATIDKAASYLKKCQYRQNGGFTYVAGNSNPTLACSGAALAALNRAGLKEDAVFNPGMDFVRKLDPKMHRGNFFFYGHHHAGKAMWLAGESDFEKWYPAIRDELVRKQQNGQWNDPTARQYPSLDTALALIILQLPNGKLPSLKR